MTEFENKMLIMMKCLNKRLSEIAEELHEMNGYTDSLYARHGDDEEKEDTDD